MIMHRCSGDRNDVSYNHESSETEPRDVTVSKSTSSMAVVSWKIPSRGLVQGYLLRYWKLSAGSLGSSVQELNITMPPLETTSGDGADVDEGADRTLYANLSPLLANATYQLEISAWRTSSDIGRPSRIIQFVTPPDCKCRAKKNNPEILTTCI